MKDRLHIWTAGLVVACSLVAAPALAAGGGEAQGFPWASWVAMLVNVAIFLFIIWYYGGSAIKEYFENRRETLIADLEEARRLRREAEAKLEEYTAKLDSLEDERKKLLDEYHEQGKREEERIIEEAKEQVARMRRDAESTIELETKKAIAELERQAVDMAVELARKIAEENIDSAHQSELIDEFVDELEELDVSESERAA